LKITCSNNYDTAFSTFSVTADADAAYAIADIITGDFSTAYTSAGSAATFVFTKTFSTPFACEYLAFAGHNFGDIGGTLSVTVDTVSKGSQVFAVGSTNSVVLFHFAEVTATTIEVTFTKTSSSDRATLAYVAAGELLPLESRNNEESGYQRAWKTRSINTRAVVNSSAAPVALLRESMTRKVALNLSNINQTITNSAAWNQFLDRVYIGGDFFIKERDGGDYYADDPTSTYMAFDAEVLPLKAHSETRALDNLSIKFSAFTGS